MNVNAPPPTAGSRLYGVVRILLLVTIIAYLAWQIYAGRAALASLTLEWNGLAIAGALFAAVAAYQCLVAGWLLLLKRTGHYAAGHTRDYQRIWWASYLYRYVPGKVMLAVERARLGQAVGIPPAAGAALTIVETLLTILAGSAVSLLAVAYYTASDTPVVIGVAVLAAGVVFVFPLCFRILLRLPVVRRRFPDLGSVALGSLDILASVLPYLLHYLLLGLSFYLVSRSLGVFTWSQFAGLCGVYALSHVLSLVALFAPGGLGVREGALAVQLARVLPAGVAEALAIGVRLWFTLVELICYFAVSLLYRSRLERLR